MVGRGRGIGGSIRVSSDSIISDISDISVVVVGGVLDMLGTAIRKSNIIRSRNNTSSITRLSSVEVSLGVVISNSVLVGIGFISIGWLRGMVSRGSVDNRGVVDNWGMVDNWGNSNSMSNWVVDGMGNWVSNNWVVDSVSNWVVDGVSNWVSNYSVVDGMSNWVVDSVSNWVSNHSMSNMATMGDNSTMSSADHMGRHSRGRGSGSKAKKGGNNESLKNDKIIFTVTKIHNVTPYLHFCSITVKQLMVIPGPPQPL